MYTKLLDKQTKLALIGLGYVGLPIAMEFAKHVSVIGFDINEDRLDKLRNCIDPCGEPVSYTHLTLPTKLEV